MVGCGGGAGRVSVVEGGGMNGVAAHEKTSTDGQSED